MRHVNCSHAHSVSLSAWLASEMGDWNPRQIRDFLSNLIGPIIGYAAAKANLFKSVFEADSCRTLVVCNRVLQDGILGCELEFLNLCYLVFTRKPSTKKFPANNKKFALSANLFNSPVCPHETTDSSLKVPQD